jgi:hypothetical protein
MENEAISHGGCLRFVSRRYPAGHFQLDNGQIRRAPKHFPEPRLDRGLQINFRVADKQGVRLAWR